MRLFGLFKTKKKKPKYLFDNIILLWYFEKTCTVNEYINSTAYIINNFNLGKNPKK